MRRANIIYLLNIKKTIKKPLQLTSEFFSNVPSLLKFNFPGPNLAFFASTLGAFVTDEEPDSIGASYVSAQYWQQAEWKKFFL